MKAYEVIRNQQLNRGIPVSELSRRTEIEYQALRNSLDGARNITANEFVVLCRELGLSLSDFEQVGTTPN